MNLYEEYLNEIETRQKQGLSAKPIDNGDLAAEIIAHVKDVNSKHHDQCVEFLIFNVLPGTTKAAGKKAALLKQVIDGDCRVDKITSDRAFELLSHMKGGASIKVLIDLALGAQKDNAIKAAKVLKTQVFFMKLIQID